jgi:hypothetical protein
MSDVSSGWLTVAGLIMLALVIILDLKGKL